MSYLEPLTVEFTPQGRRDFIEVLTFTLVKWGAGQRRLYAQQITDELVAISRNPVRGRHRMGLPGEDLTSLIGSHIVIYRVSRNKVRILRICHQCMNLAKHV